MKLDLVPANKDKEKKNEGKEEDNKRHKKINNRVKNKVNNENDNTKIGNLPDTNLKLDLKYDENDLQSLILYARQKMTGAVFFAVFRVPMNYAGYLNEL